MEDVKSVDEEVEELRKTLEALKSEVADQAKARSKAFFKKWFVAFFILFTVIAFCGFLALSHLIRMAADVAFIANTLEHPDTEIEIQTIE